MINHLKMSIIDHLIHPKEEVYRLMEAKKSLYNILVHNQLFKIVDTFNLSINHYSITIVALKFKIRSL
jgi:hypothetical protein